MTTSGVPGEAPIDDPIAVLLAEHRTILLVLDEVERESRRLEASAVLRESFWSDLFTFADRFDVGMHHEKEEQLLFPALERAGLSRDGGPTAVLRDEHLRTHFFRSRLEQALTRRDRARLAAAAASYVDFVRAHVLKENQILFPLARRLLPAEAMAELRRDFAPLATEQRIDRWLRPGYSLGPYSLGAGA